MPKVLNDSGCLLGDNDLFDAQLEEEVMEEEDEESLDAIRGAVKKKAKNKVRGTDLLRVAAIHRCTNH